MVMIYRRYISVSVIIRPESGIFKRWNISNHSFVIIGTR